MSISLREVGHTYGSTRVLENLDLALEPGELLCVLGPSGSGKSTILKLLAGLEKLQTGSIELGELTIQPDNCPPAEARPIGLVFQEHALFPHLTVKQNLEFGLNKLPAEERDRRVSELLSSIELSELQDRLPSMLSGGQQQRVALARALAPQPEVLLLDEPFASVDVLLKNRLRDEMRTILKALGSTSVLVTHDPEDAMLVADRVAVIVAGKLVQIGSPRELWEAPGHPFVAEVFSGHQMLAGTVDGDRVETAFGPVSNVNLGDLQGNVILSVMPSSISLSPNDGAASQVQDIRFSKGQFQTVIQSGAESLMAVSETHPNLSLGQSVSMTVAPEALHAYNCE